MQDRNDLCLLPNPRLSLGVLLGQHFPFNKRTCDKPTSCHTGAHDPKIPQAPRKRLLDR